MRIFGNKLSERIQKTARALGLAALGLFAQDGARANDISSTVQSAVHTTIYAPNSHTNDLASKGLIIHDDGSWDHTTGSFIDKSGMPRSIDQDSCSLKAGAHKNNNHVELICGETIVATATHIGADIRHAIDQQNQKESKSVQPDIEGGDASLGAPTNQTGNRDTHPAPHASISEPEMVNTQIDEQLDARTEQDVASSGAGENSSKGFWYAFLGGALGAFSAIGATALFRRFRQQKKDTPPRPKMQDTGPVISSAPTSHEDVQINREDETYRDQAQKAFQIRQARTQRRLQFKQTIQDLNEDREDIPVSVLSKNISLIEACETLQFLFFEIHESSAFSMEEYINGVGGKATDEEKDIQQAFKKLRDASEDGGRHINQIKMSLGNNDIDQVIRQYAEMQQHIGIIKTHLAKFQNHQRYQKITEEFLHRIEVDMASIRGLIMPVKPANTSQAKNTRENA